MFRVAAADIGDTGRPYVAITVGQQETIECRAGDQQRITNFRQSSSRLRQHCRHADRRPGVRAAGNTLAVAAIHVAPTLVLSGAIAMAECITFSLGLAATDLGPTVFGRTIN